MINVDKHIGIPLKRGGAAMKKKSISAFVITGLLSVLLSGCQGKEEAGGGVLEDTSKPVISMEGKHTEEENDGKAEENTGMARTETEDPNAGKQVETEMDKRISALQMCIRDRGTENRRLRLEDIKTFFSKIVIVDIIKFM